MANEKRLIDANALKERFKLRIDWLEKDKHDEYTTGIWDGCLYDEKLIDEAPTVDAVEVVRCKDCLFSRYFEESGTRKCRTMQGLYRTVEDDDFCSYGERKE